LCLARDFGLFQRQPWSFERGDRITHNHADLFV
jgi:hypothetical protein